MGRVFSPRLSQKCLRRALDDCLLATLLRDIVVKLDLSLRHTVIRVRIDSWLRLLDVACDRCTTRGADRLQQAGADFRPSDQKKWPYRIERCLTELARNERLRTFSASVTTLAKISSRRAGRRTSGTHR
ncbi:hypothetical protein GCM10018954_018660 [Kutzneria kofuensis]